MSFATYASLRQTTPGVTFTTAAGGSLSAGSAWFCISARNRVGRNLLSVPVQLTWTTGQKVVCTISPAARANGEEIYEYLISASPTNTPAQMKQIRAWRARHPLTIGPDTYPGQGIPKSLPHLFEFTTDAQLAICPAVANLAALPASGLGYGAMRLVGGTQYVRYDDEATAGIQAAAVGYWVAVTESELLTYLTSTTLDGGCDQPLSAITEPELIYSPPAYPGDGSDSSPVRFWLSNGLTTNGVAQPQGSRVRLQLFGNGRDLSVAFADRAFVTLVGYVNRATGQLLGSPLQQTTTWNPTTPLELPAELAPGVAAVYELSFRFFQPELGGIVGNGTRILLNLFIEGLLGSPDSSWAITGDTVLGIGDRLRIVPAVGGLRRLGGACLVKGYKSPNVGIADLGGLPSNSAALQVAISAALSAEVNVKPAAAALLDSEARRALVGTAPGVQTPSAWVSVSTTPTNRAISVGLTYPTVVRPNYPDITGGLSAQFNAPLVRLFVRYLDEIYQMPDITPVAGGQTVLIDALPLNVILDLPSSAPSFGLFDYNSPTAQASSAPSTLDVGNYEICIAYVYPSPNAQITYTSHAVADGCLGELEPLQDALNASSAVLVGTDPPASSQGQLNDVYFQTTSTNELKLYRKNAPTSWTEIGSLAPSDGQPGANSYALVDLGYTQPAAGSTVAVELTETGWLRAGLIIQVVGGGYYRVDSVASSSAVLENLGYSENAAPGATILTNSLVLNSGARGAAGAGAFSTLTANYEQPAANNTLTVTVASTAWMAVGQTVYVESSGSYRVQSIGSATSVTLIWLNFPGDAGEGDLIVAPKRVVASGGATGGGGGGGGPVQAETVTLEETTAEQYNANNTSGTLYFYDNQLKVTTGSYPFGDRGWPIALAGKRTLWLPALAWYPSGLNGCGPLASIATGANTPTLRGLSFPGNADTYAETLIYLPRRWRHGANCEAILYWSRPTGGVSTGTEWTIQSAAWTPDNRIITNDPFPTEISFPLSSNPFSDQVIRIAANITIHFDTDFGNTPSAPAAAVLKVGRLGSADEASDEACFLGLALVYDTDKPNDHDIW